jgi:tRNA-2-methylthio-N6-dimethylallyladenosine synthase
MTKYKNIMPYVHLPIQSGDEDILKAMNRTMSIKDYVNNIKYLRKVIPNCAISTDIIVGFPNETEKQFNNTIKLLKQIKFDNVFAFIYSPRVGTRAAQIEDKTDLSIKQTRLKQLNDLIRRHAKLNNKK